VILKKKQWIVALIVVAVLAALVVWGRDRIHFDFRLFLDQVSQANGALIALGIACIYIAYGFRAVRWSYLMRHNQRVSPLSLLGSQVIGFTAVALIGRVADPVRPFLVSKKTGSPVSAQIAVYIVERLFDFGAMALVISAVILTSPAGSMPHPELMRKAGYGGLAATVGAGIFLVFVRLFGNVIAKVFEDLFGAISPKLGQAAGHKIRSFHKGLDTIRSLSDFVVSLSLSLVMWALITAAYVVTLRAFTASPELASMNLTRGIILMAISGGASALQLPIIGWFTQIAVVAASLSGLFGAAPEAATAAAATLLLVTFLSIIPVGLIWAQVDNISLRSVAAESAGKNLEEEE
jgi:glycosyltransferase 2 family protein